MSTNIVADSRPLSMAPFKNWAPVQLLVDLVLFTSIFNWTKQFFVTAGVSISNLYKPSVYYPLTSLLLIS